jgi:hypothetical protein
MNSLRLDPYFRAAIYVVLTLLFASGALWLVADALKDGPNGEAWQEAAADLLMLHGGAAMLTLLLVGALFPVHMRRAWLRRRNRVSGSTMAAVNVGLIVTAFGLYYLGSEELRPWISDAHIAIGIAAPVLLVTHIVLGRRSARDERAKPVPGPAG